MADLTPDQEQGIIDIQKRLTRSRARLHASGTALNRSDDRLRDTKRLLYPPGRKQFPPHSGPDAGSKTDEPR